MVNIVIYLLSAIFLTLAGYFIIVTRLYNKSSKHFINASSLFLNHRTEEGRSEQALGEDYKRRADAWFFRRHV